MWGRILSGWHKCDEMLSTGQLESWTSCLPGYEHRWLSTQILIWINTAQPVLIEPSASGLISLIQVCVFNVCVIFSPYPFFLKLKGVSQWLLLVTAPCHVQTQMVHSALALGAQQHVTWGFYWMGPQVLNAPPWACGAQKSHNAYVRKW